MDKRAKKILEFWFLESSSEEKFSRNDEFDRKIKDNFYLDYQKAIENKYDYWQDNAEECLALIILLDQFSRNLFRSNNRAFTMDKKARIIAKKAISNKYHISLPNNQILFIFLPLMHSEELNDQIYCGELIDKFLKDNLNYEEIKKFSKIHLEIIKKFGRFPYRNKVLHRESTIEENEYLKSNHHNFFNV